MSLRRIKLRCILKILCLVVKRPSSYLFSWPMDKAGYSDFDVSVMSKMALHAVAEAKVKGKFEQRSKKREERSYHCVTWRFISHGWYFQSPSLSFFTVILVHLVIYLVMYVNATPGVPTSSQFIITGSIDCLTL